MSPAHLSVFFSKTRVDDVTAGGLEPSVYLVDIVIRFQLPIRALIAVLLASAAVAAHLPLADLCLFSPVKWVCPCCLHRTRTTTAPICIEIYVQLIL